MRTLRLQLKKRGPQSRGSPPPHPRRGGEAPALGGSGPGRGDPTSHKGASPEELAGPPRSHPPQKGRLRGGGRLGPGELASTRRGADAEGAAPRSARGRARTPRGAGVAEGPRATPKGAEEGAGAAGGGRAGLARRTPGPICREPARRWGQGAAMSRQEAASRGRRPTAPGEEGKGSGPVEPDALTTGAGAAAEERIATGRGGERPPPFSRAPGPGAIAIAARSGSRLGGSGPGVVLTTGSGLKGGRGVCRWLRGS